MYPRTYYPNYITNADAIFSYCQNNLDWKSYMITLFGKQMEQPRRVAFYADTGLKYHYSQTFLYGSGRDAQIDGIKKRINQDFGLGCNSVLCNLYRDGRDSMGRHSDDETELGPDPSIVSVTLGQERVFKLRHKVTKEVISLTLQHGSLLYMGPTSQTQREHCIPKTTRPLGPRINCTFRTILL